jgi:hypothetical protein
VAWRLPVSSVRLFWALALTVSGAIVASSLAATVVITRNAEVLADARNRSLRIATSVTEFRRHLSLAEEEVATTLVSGEPESAPGRARYEAELLQAGPSLTNAGLVDTGESTDDIAMLAERLTRYAALVETSRAYPVGSTFSHLARATARDELVPTAGRVRRTAEQDVLDAAVEVSGRGSGYAMAALVIALIVLLASAALVAGRTRRLVHPALVAAAIILLGNIVVLSGSLPFQTQQMRTAARAEIATYIDANATAFLLFDLRADELDAVAASGDVESRYAEFSIDAGALAARLDDGSPDDRVLLPSMQAYTDSVAEVEERDQRGDHRAAVDDTLSGDSAVSYREARALAVSTVDRAAADLARQLDATLGAGVTQALPAWSGLAAAVLTVAGFWARGRRYR